MKAMVITNYTGVNGLKLLNISAPEPTPDEVALDVDFAGANYVEALFAEGLVPNPLPWVPGIEASGRIRTPASEMNGVEPGQPIAALTINTGGAYGQVAVTHRNLVAPLPPGMDPALAAVVPSNTTTALIALEQVAHLRPGDRVLVHGAAGGLGSQFGQIARLLGASRVVGTVGVDAKRQAALDLGYDEIWLRDDISAHDAGRFDIIVDPVSGPIRSESLPLLDLGGCLLAVGDAAQAGDQQISSNTLWFTGTGVRGFNLGALSASRPDIVGRYLRRALRLVASGEVTVQLTGRAPVEDAPRVLADLRARRTTGKIVLFHDRG